MPEQNAKDILTGLRADMHRQYITQGQIFVDRVLLDIFPDEGSVRGPGSLG